MKITSRANKRIIKGLDNGLFGIDFKEKTVHILDSGNASFPASTLDYVGKSVAAVLQHEAETANKYIDVAEFNVTQNQVVQILEEESGHKFTRTHGTTAEL